MDGIKIGKLKVSYPEVVDHTERQITIVSRIDFEKADVSVGFEKSGKLEEIKKLDAEHPGDFGGYSIEEEALVEYISDFDKELKEDLEKQFDHKFRNMDSLPDYVSCEVEVNIFGKDPKDMHGSFEVHIFVDVPAAGINSTVEDIFDTLR